MFSTPRRTLLVAWGVMVLLWLPCFVRFGGQSALDDWWIRATFAGKPQLLGMRPFDLFRFSSGDPAQWLAQVQQGPVPWFAPPELKLAMWRPLSTLTHNLDQLLFSYNSKFAALHSLSWALGMLAGAARLFRSRLSPRVAALSTLLFAMAGSHVEPTVWTAARNGLVSGCFGFWALALHLESQSSGDRGTPRLAWVLFACSLLGGEAGLGILAYFVAFHLVGRQAVSSMSGVERIVGCIRAVLPFLAISLVWAFAYFALGYGTAGSGVYLNPAHEPLAFLAQLPERMLTQLGALVLGLPIAVWMYFPDLRSLFAAVGVLGCFFSWLAWRHLMADKPHELAELRWFMVGTVLAVVPQSSGLLGPRSLLVPSLGVAAVVAAVLVSGLEWKSERPSKKRDFGRKAVWGALALVHVGLAALAWFDYCVKFGNAVRDETVAFRASELRELQGKRAVVLSSGDPFFAVYASSRLIVDEGITPLSWNFFDVAQVSHKVTRTGSAELRIEQRETRGIFLQDLYRSDSAPLGPHSQVDCGTMKVTVLEAAGPSRQVLSISFEKPLEDAEYVFLAWQRGAFRRVAVPAIGQTIELSFEKGPWNLL